MKIKKQLQSFYEQRIMKSKLYIDLLNAITYKTSPAKVESKNMKIEITVEPKHWWIERRDNGCEVMLRYEGKDTTGKPFTHEQHYHADTPQEAVAWLNRQLEGKRAQ